jgi:arginyl-tRNA synthetase
MPHMKTDLELGLQHIIKDGVTHLLGKEAEFSLPIPLVRPEEAHGDFASPIAFQLAKQLKRPAPQLAKDLLEHITKHLEHHEVVIAGKKWSGADLIDRLETAGPFINIWLSVGFLTEHLGAVLKEGQKFGQVKLKKQPTIVLEFSGVNIGKPFSIGHLRSTVNGAAIGNLLEAAGNKVIRVNYIGDWGTQFGKLIAAYKHWSNAEKVAADPINELQRIYVKFHEEAEKDSKLADEGRAWSKKLEEGDTDAIKLWTLFRKESLAHAKQIYALLETNFTKGEDDDGEARYRDKLGEVLELLKEKKLLKKSQGAQIVDLEDQKLPPFLVQRSDEASLYATRELAAAIERQKKYRYDAMLYEVGQEQELHFKQTFAVLRKLGFPWAEKLEHIKHGHYNLKGKKMRTRAGTVADMKAILVEAIARAKRVIQEKNPELKNIDATAQQVGIGAVKYNDLSQNRLHAIDFDFDRMLSLEGNSAPYLQYTQARIQSIFRKADLKFADQKVPTSTDALFDEKEERTLLRRLTRYPEVVRVAAEKRLPHLLATELYELASRFNLFYGKLSVLKADKIEKAERLALCAAVATLLRNGLQILGIHAPEEM